MPPPVSIHAPRARGDRSVDDLLRNRPFQFTPLVRGATRPSLFSLRSGIVSIHAPRARGDDSVSSFEGCEVVSIHAPRARGDVPHATFARAETFQFTPLVRGATFRPAAYARTIVFQFTPLVRGATDLRTSVISCDRFNSRPSCEGRPCPPRTLPRLIVSIHAPRARGDGHEFSASHHFVVSIHAPRARGDRTARHVFRPTAFQFTPLVRGATSDGEITAGSERFNSRPSCEGRLCWLNFTGFLYCFNSRPSCEGRRR